MKKTIMLIVLLSMTSAWGNPHYVATNGLHVSPFLTWANAATNLADATSVAGDGATIIVDRGLYIANKTIAIAGDKSVIITSLWGAAETIIDGNGQLMGGAWPYGMYIGWGDGLVEVHGLTIRNFDGPAVARRDGTRLGALYNCIIGDSSQVSPGSGIWQNAGHLLISNCVVHGNSSTDFGGGLNAGNGLSLRIYDSVFTGNHTDGEGGGIRVNYTNAVIVNTVVSNNISRSNGGGIRGSAGLIVSNSTIVGNSATNGGGGGIHIASTITHSVISNNYASGHGGGARSVAAVRNSVIASNVSSNYGGGTHGVSEVTDCLVVGNYARNGGGGIYNASLVRNCLVIHNSASGMDFAGQGGGIGAGGIVANCTVVSNHSDWVSGGVFRSYCVNSIIYYNTAGVNSNYWLADTVPMPWTNCITAPDPATVTIGGTDCITDPPMFGVAPDHFKPVKGSPAINAGVNQDWMIGAKDFQGYTRIGEGIVDIGAFEYHPPGTLLIVR